MNKSDDDGASDTEDPSQPRAATPHEGASQTALEKDMTRRESAVIDDTAAIQSREKSATARENAAEVREEAAHLREEEATLREREIHAAGALAASNEQIIMLQQANEHLVIATIEAHKLAEQVQTGKDQLDHLAHHDVLTDLPNRVLLQDRLSLGIESARRQGKQLAVMFMDVDRFKHINDSLGHAVGDQLLRSVAKRLTAIVRSSDTVCRQGGDEFVILLADVEHAKDVALTAQKILTALTVPYCIDQLDLHITVSIGVSIFPDDGQDADTLIKNADTAMYHVKAGGRNNCQFFEQNMSVLAVERHSIESGLRHALERQEFVLYYQPKINLQSGSIVGVEALIRWQHPDRGLLQPAQFVSIAEDCGLILPIGRWVLREACRQARAWLQAGLPPITVAVNTSALEFRAKGFLKNIRATLEEAQLEPRYLELELTESVLMRDAESTDSLLHALANLGVKLAIDDFGTGYSSLSYLRRFPIDTLKIDQSFVTQITSNPDDATIVSAVISMGKNLKQRVIAEGVETPEQHAFLLAQHCDEGQGYYLGRPMVAEELAALLQTGVSTTLPH